MENTQPDPNLSTSAPEVHQPGAVITPGQAQAVGTSSTAQPVINSTPLAAPSVAAPSAPAAPIASIPAPISDVSQPLAEPTATVGSAPDSTPSKTRRKWLVPSAILVVLLLVGAGGVVALAKHRAANPKPVAQQSASPTSSSKPAPQQSAALNPSSSSDSTAIIHPNFESLFSVAMQHWANNKGIYPADISPSTLANEHPDPTIFVLPGGYKYTYTLSPAGCTPGTKACTDFTLQVVKTADGSVVETESTKN